MLTSLAAPRSRPIPQSTLLRCKACDVQAFKLRPRAGAQKELDTSFLAIDAKVAFAVGALPLCIRLRHGRDPRCVDAVTV
jgi:hypothetical protein